MTKRIVLCADDYGQALSISSGIIDLIQRNRLSATSCMVNGDHWREQAMLLKPYQTQIDIGLHFNLTEGKPVSAAYRRKYGDSFFPLSEMMARSMLRKLDKSTLIKECEAQIMLFHEVLGFMPHFIDGHQHIHQFPVIRDAVLANYETHLRAHRAYVRIAREKISIKLDETVLNIKKLVINNMGAAALKRCLKEKNIPYNQSFAGIYLFANAQSYGAYFRRFLQEVGDQGLIMCHPGYAVSGSLSQDAIAEARAAEYQYLASDQFIKDCEAAGNVVLSRFS